MHKTKKQILGVLGLGLVTAMTAVAVALPAPSANAVNSGDVELKVVVHTEAPSVAIQTPSDGAEYATAQIPISNIYSKAAVVHYQLTYIAPNGTRTDYTLPDYIAATTGTADGTHNWTLDLGNYGGQYGDYILTATVGAVSDYVSFTYNSSKIDDNPTTDPVTGDPVVTVSYGDDVCSLKFQAYHKTTGVALFNPEYTYTIPTPRPATNTVSVMLPFNQYNAEAGSYRVVVQTYGCGNQQDDPIGNEDEIDIDDFQPQDDDDATPSENGDPIVPVKYNFSVEVCSVKFQAFHKTTNAALFHPEYEHKIDPASMSGTFQVTLPFAENGAEAGSYTITATFYDCAGNSITGGDQSWDFDGYTKPFVPGVPDTGGGLFAGLNFSRGDYLATGLVIFMIALIIAIRVMASKNRKSNRR